MERTLLPANLACLVIALVAATGSACAFSQEKYKPATVCEIADSPRQFDQTQVSVDARFFSAFPHFAFLRDDRCPGTTLSLEWQLEGADPSIQKLNDLLYSFTTEGIPGKFCGQLQTDPRNKKRLYLHVQRVVDLKPPREDRGP